jgi:exopolysaccharide production protein ExoZ
MNPELHKYSQAIYVAKGIAITLIVIGHYSPYLPDYPMPDYWRLLHHGIDTFIMSFFMFLSGFLFAGSSQVFNDAPYYSIIKSKAKRLLIPFISISMIACCSKLIIGSFYGLTHPVTISSFKNMLLNPFQSFEPILWFLYVLFEIFVVFSISRYITNNILILLGVYIILSLLPPVDIFMIGTLFCYLPVFTIGFISFRYGIFNNQGVGLGIISLSFFIILIISNYFINYQGIAQRCFRLLIGVAGSIFWFSTAIQIGKNNNKIIELMKYVGIYTMAIYLFHSQFMVAIQIFLLQVVKLSYPGFLGMALVTIIIGLSFPILLEKYCLNRYSIVAQLVLGAKK